MKSIRFIIAALISITLLTTSTASYGALYDAIKQNRTKSNSSSRSNSGAKNGLFSKAKRFYDLNTHNQLKNRSLACGSGRSKYQHCK